MLSIDHGRNDDANLSDKRGRKYKLLFLSKIGERNDAERSQAENFWRNFLRFGCGID